MVSIPAPGYGRRYEYMIMPGEDPDIMVARKTIGDILGQFRHIPDEDIIRAVVYRFHALVAERFVDGRIALLGDAAHLTPPFAGQGMNAGLRDAFNVAWKVARIVRDKSGAELLSSYHTERKGPVKEMVDYAVALGEIVMPIGGVDEDARARIRAELMGTDSPEGAARMQAKPQAAYDDGLLRKDDDDLGDTLTGQPLPQFLVSSNETAAVMLDDVLGQSFALLAVGKDAEASLTSVEEISDDVRKVSLGEGCAVQALANEYGLSAQSGRILLVRPDRFVAATWSHENADRIADDIKRLV